jgi:hypothetical protein
MAEKSAATAHRARPSAEGRADVRWPRPARPAVDGAVVVGTPCHDWPSPAWALTPKRPLAPMGKVAAHVLLCPTGKRPAFRERGRLLRRRQDGYLLSPLPFPMSCLLSICGGWYVFNEYAQDFVDALEPYQLMSTIRMQMF